MSGENASASACRAAVLRRWLRRLLRLGLGLLALILLYIAAGFGLGAIPRNSGFRNTPGGIPVWIFSNGMHTAIVLPAVENGSDFPAHFRHPDAGTYSAPRWVMVGWGDREFFASVPQWSDLTPGLACGSFLGTHGSALNLSWLTRPPRADLPQFLISPEQHERLCRFIRSAAQPGPDGYPVPLPMPQTRADPQDVYYPSGTSYHLFRTCNVWTSEALHAAGLPCGVWTPFAPSVMRHAAAHAASVP